MGPGPALLMRKVKVNRIILSADTASEVRQLPERRLSLKAGIVRYCLKCENGD